MVLLSLKLMSGWDLLMRVCHVCHGLDHCPHHHASHWLPLPLHFLQETRSLANILLSLLYVCILSSLEANWGSSAQAQVFVNALKGVQVCGVDLTHSILADLCLFVRCFTGGCLLMPTMTYILLYCRASPTLLTT